VRSMLLLSAAVFVLLSQASLLFAQPSTLIGVEVSQRERLADGDEFDMPLDELLRRGQFSKRSGHRRKVEDVPR